MNTPRKIKYIVVHCTATPPGASIDAIKRYWREHLLWKQPGYHYIILRSGQVVQLQDEAQISNGVLGHNAHSIHISYIGGIDVNGRPKDNRTPEQISALYKKIVELTGRYPQAEVLGHRDFPGVKKACPSFDVKTWLATYTPAA